MLMRSKDYLFLNARNDLFTFEALKVQFLGHTVRRYQIDL